jgi:hypothetical protein
MARVSSDWATAMENELAYVPDDREALRWAIGCCGAAYAARLTRLVDEHVIVRALGAAVVLFCAFDVTLPSLLTIAHHSGVLSAAGLLASVVPHDAVGRLVPLMHAVPIWLHLLGAIAGASYIGAAFLLLGKVRRASACIVAGVGVALVARVLAEPILAPIGRVTPDPSFLSAVLVPIAAPLVVAIVARRT